MKYWLIAVSSPVRISFKASSSLAFPFIPIPPVCGPPQRTRGQSCAHNTERVEKWKDGGAARGGAPRAQSDQSARAAMSGRSCVIRAAISSRHGAQQRPAPLRRAISLPNPRADGLDSSSYT
jgi:hypothetical protein